MLIKDDAARRRYFRDYMRERHAGQQKKPGPNGPDAEVQALREQIRALENELENAKRATAVAAEEVALTMELQAAEKHISTLQARVTRAEQAAKEAAANADTELQRKFADASKKLAEARARLRALAKSPAGKVFILGANRRKILRCLHPDAVPDPALKRRYEEAFQIFSNLPYTEIQDD
jgi:chromosome segregation ATPase